MAGHLELHSFVGKFWKLWRTGQNARMSVECQAGKATVNLQLDLGLPHYHHPQQHHEKQVGPSRLRRSARRAQARADAAVNAARATTAAVDAAVQPNNTNPAAVHAATLKKDEAQQAAAPTLPLNKEAAVQVVPQATDAAADHGDDGCGGGRVHQQKAEERRRDLENLQMMLENIENQSKKTPQTLFKDEILFPLFHISQGFSSLAIL